jgi:hypothetical protein
LILHKIDFFKDNYKWLNETSSMCAAGFGWRLACAACGTLCLARLVQLMRVGQKTFLLKSLSFK